MIVAAANHSSVFLIATATSSLLHGPHLSRVELPAIFQLWLIQQLTGRLLPCLFLLICSRRTIRPSPILILAVYASLLSLPLLTLDHLDILLTNLPPDVLKLLVALILFTLERSHLGLPGALVEQPRLMPRYLILLSLLCHDQLFHTKIDLFLHSILHQKVFLLLYTIAHLRLTFILQHLYMNPSLGRLLLPLKYLNPIFHCLDLRLRRLPQHALLEHLYALIDQKAPISGPSLALPVVDLL